MKQQKKVLVALSGGMDSGVSAYLLKEREFEVSGVFMKLNDSRGNAAAQRKAKAIARFLGIPFFVFDFRKQFKKEIIDYFFSELKEGNTPNPCVFCNEKIKFGVLLKMAEDKKADFLATGHYIKIKKTDGAVKILKPKDKNKDQTYFLWRLKQRQLKKLIFPMADCEKKEIKKMVKKIGLPIPDNVESQEICFIEGKTEDFIKKHIKLKPGNIVDKQGRILGKHKGLWFYTIGQRKGIGLAQGPYFVVEKDRTRNNLIVSKDAKDLYKKEIGIKNINWISGKPLFNAKVKAKIRYGHREAAVVIKKGKAVFDKPQKAPTAGQSIVFYKGNELLGGAIIK
ncbi:MAG: tRNA 2-thiouridine(34) synthase MnmA [Candidatus Pacebacteria bacterium]|nr:tRNA 2-thiouridine(34) synthase MnmA [Candidatus Paceibacterota bacterium]